MPGPYAEDEKCQDFAGNLNTMLEAKRWQRADLAAACNYSYTVISNILTFVRAPTVPNGEAFDRAFKLTDVFTAKARAIRGEAFSESFTSFAEHEATADDVYIYEHSLIPGLVQTEAYARAVFRTLLNITDEEVERLMSARMSRQEVLFGKGRKHPRLWALVDEAALDRPVGSARVMHDQCMRILEVSKLAHVSLAVIPYSAGGHIGLTGACTIVERDGSPRIVNLEDFADGRVSEDPAIVRRAALRFRGLQHEALPSGASRDMLIRKARRWQELASSDGARVLTALPTGDSA